MIKPAFLIQDFYVTYQRDARAESWEIWKSVPTVVISTCTSSLFDDGSGLSAWSGQVVGAGVILQVTLTFSNSILYDPAGGAATLALSNGLIATCINVVSGNEGTPTLVFHSVLGSPPPRIVDLHVLEFNSTGCASRPGDTLNFGLPAHPVEFAGIQKIVCFLRGTRIAVPGGESPVEGLRIGDLVRLAEPAAAPRRIKWIGRRSYSADSIARHRTAHPVIIHQGALGDHIPARDLAVSPMHGVNIGGVFYPAIALLNGISITRAVPDGAIDYFHIELDTHETILAEGAPVESYRDEGCRLLFDNADTYFNWPGGAVHLASATPQRVNGGILLHIVRSRLAEHAGAELNRASPGPLVGLVERIVTNVLEGWAVDTANPLVAVQLEISMHGQVIGRTIANIYRVDLDHHRIGHGVGGFRFVLPQRDDIALQAMEVRRISDGAQLAILQMTESE